MKTFLIILMIIISSCNNTSQNNINTASKSAGNDSIETQKDTISNTEINDSIIHISFPKDSTWVTVNAKMKGFNHPVTVYITICRDPKDNYLLSLAKDGKADYLITGDQDLLILEKFEQTSICLLNQFLRCL